MARQVIENNWTGETRIAIESNFKELYGEFLGAGNNATDAKRLAIEAVTAANTAGLKADAAKAEAESIKAQLDLIIVEGDSSVEAAAARVAKDGETYATLKARLDSENTDVTEKLAETLDDLRGRGIDVTNPPAPLTPVVNDGTDQAESINSIISYAHSNKIKNILFPDEDYWVHPGSYDNVPTGSGGGINLLDGIHLILSPEATIKALPSDGAGYNIIRSYQKKNIGIIGGTIEGERNTHIGTTGEWGHGINIKGCDHVYIDTTVKDCWGDGLYLGRGGDKACTNVFIKRYEAYNNRRQGTSFIHVDGLYADTLILDGTGGANPQAGIDMEPNANEQVINVFINTIHATNNTGAGVQVYADRDGALVDNVVIDKVVSQGNDYGLRIRRDKVKGVSIGTIIAKNNTTDGVRIEEGSTGVVINTTIVKDNGLRGVSLTGVGGNVFNEIYAYNNKSAALEFGNLHGENIVNVLVGEAGVLSSYVLRGASSTGVSIGKAKLKGGVESAFYLRTVSNSNFEELNITDSSKYPVRLSNSKNNSIRGGKIGVSGFSSDNAYSYVYIEDNSNDNIIRGLSGSIGAGYKAKYAFQAVNSTGNRISFNDFPESTYTQSFAVGKPTNTFTYNTGDVV